MAVIYRYNTGFLSFFIIGNSLTNSSSGCVKFALYTTPMRIHPNNISHSAGLADTLMEYLPCALLIIEAEGGMIAGSNSAARACFGCTSEEELDGKDIHELFAYPDKLSHVLKLSCENKTFKGTDTAFRRTDGTLFYGPYECVWQQPVSNDSGASILIFIHQPQAKLRDMQSKLAESTSILHRKTKEFDQFTYIVSHDLKAPMRAISNLASWIEEDLSPLLTDESKNNLALLRNRVARMEALMNGISAYSKIGREVIHLEKVDVGTLLQEAIRSLSPAAHVSVCVNGDMPVLFASRKMLLQIFTHLIDNAIKHNDKSEVSVIITSRRMCDMHEFEIADNGPGIAEENHEVIFAMLRTLQARDKFESTGVGLTIVKRILEDCGGNIVVKSEIGKGSRFIFQWPVRLEKKAFSSKINLG
jgi:K+-sensing histidine kinase KdpD